MGARANVPAGFGAFDQIMAGKRDGASEGSWSLGGKMSNGAGLSDPVPVVDKDINCASNSESLEKYMKNRQNIRDQAYQSVP